MLRRAVAASPSSGRACLALARALFNARAIAESIPFAERAAALLPDDPAATELLGRLRGMEGRFGEATTLFRRTLEIEPGNSGVRELLDRLTATDRRK